MARRVSVEIVGSSESVERAFSRAGRSATTFQRDFSKTTRGVLSGSGVFRGLGRSLAFASGGFLAFASAADVVRKSIDAAESTEKAFKSLAAQAKASGKDIKTVFADVSKLQAPAQDLGFNKVDVEQGFTTLLRGTGSAKRAFEAMAAAEAVARVKRVLLSSAALIVNRALVSSGNSARSLGIHFPKAASQAEKLQIILAKFSGQARANTTEEDRFRAALFNTEVLVGQALLPAFDRLLTSLTSWLSKSKNQTAVQRDVTSAVRATVSVLHALASAVRAVDKATGSFKNTVEDLLVAFAAFRAAGIASSFAGIGIAAGAAEGRVAVLAGALARLKAIGPIVISIGVLETIKAIRSGKAGTLLGGGGTKGESITKFLFQGDPFGEAIAHAIGLNIGGNTPQGPTVPLTHLPGAPTISQTNEALAKAAKAAATAADTARKSKKPFSLKGQFNIDELLLAQAQAAGDTAAQRSILISEAGILKSLASQAKTLKDRTQITQQLASVEDQIRSIDSAGLSAAKKAAKKAADAAKKAAAFNVPLQLQVDQARLQALGKPITAILKKIKATAEKALKSGRLGLQGQLDAWNTIANVNDELKNQATSALNGFKQANIDKLTKGLGLSPEAIRALKARLSQLGPGGTVPMKGVGAFGVVVGPNGRDLTVHTTVNLDGKKVAANTTKHQQRRKLRNPPQRRGTYAGGL